MDNRINILNELKELDAAILINTDNKNHFFIPGNYFNDLSETIITRVFIQSLPPVNPYKVPLNYFENLADIVLEKVQFEENAQGINAFKQSTYKVPEGYFDNFAGTVLQKIKYSALTVQQELEELSPLLNSISKANVYTVPENYFNQFEVLPGQGILPETKVVSMGSKTRRWLNYAAAACIAAVLFGSGYLYFSGKNTYSVVQSSIPQVAQVDVQQEISTLSDDEINKYLNDNNKIAVYTNINDADQPKMDMQSLLQNVSDEEIQDYLSQDPESHQTGGGI